MDATRSNATVWPSRTAVGLLALVAAGFPDCPPPEPPDGSTDTGVFDPGAPEPIEGACGDGALNPGEACDDGNLDLGDGCNDVCEITPFCLTQFGEAQPFNVFSFTHILGTPDIEGKIAAGNTIELTGFSVAREDPGGSAAVASVLNLISGQLYGDAVYSGSISLDSVGFVGPHGPVMDDPIDFFYTEFRLKAFSLWLDELAVNGTTNVIAIPNVGTILELTGTDPNLNVFELSGADLDAAVSFSVSAPAGSAVVINVDGTAVQPQSFEMFQSGVGFEDILWNFSEAISLDIVQLNMDGSVLAPWADVNFSNGAMDGQLFARLVDGTAEYHLAPFAHEFPCDEPVCGDGVVNQPWEVCDDGNTVQDDGCRNDCTSPEQICIPDLGAAEPFNVFVFDDYTGGPDVAGKLAAGDVVDLDGYSIGREDPGGAAVIGDVLQLAHGMIYGDAVYGTSSSISNTGFDGGTEVQGTPIDFVAAEAELTGLSGFLGAMPANGVTNVTPIPGGALLVLEGYDPVFNIFEVAASDLDASSSFTVRVPPGSTVLINLTGTSFGPADFAFFYEGAKAERTLFNAPQATMIDMTRLSWQGTLLAPYADVLFLSGHVDGQVIARSVSGDGEYHDVKFEGVFPCPPAPPTAP